MGKLRVFNFVSLNGYFKGPNGDLSWHKQRDGGEDENEYAIENLKTGGTLLFGRVTYEMMAGYWPTADAIKNNPKLAQGMNDSDKIVFSKTLKKATWSNTKLVTDSITGEIQKMKSVPGKDMTILGSGSIVTQCAEHGLIDEYQIMIDPVAIGSGTPLFSGIKKNLNLALIKNRVFKNGIVLLCYAPDTK